MHLKLLHMLPLLMLTLTPKKNAECCLQSCWR
jgi:hypothetical protein